MKETKTETVAELQARNAQLETSIAALKAKDDAVSKAELRAAYAEAREIQSAIKLTQQEERMTALEASQNKVKEQNADQAVARMVKAGRLAVRDQELQATYKAKFVADPDLIPLMAGEDMAPVAPLSAANGRMTPGAAALGRSNEGGDSYQITAGNFDLKNAFEAYYKIIARNASIKVNAFMQSEDRNQIYTQKGMLALEAANFYKRVLKPNLEAWNGVPMTELGRLAGAVRVNKGALEAADVTQATNDAAGNPLDPTNTLGTLSGTLVLQRVLPLFVWKYPELMMMTTDFSDAPGLYEQPMKTRIISQMAVQKYDARADATGRPKGWSTMVPSVSTDATITLTDYIAVPIVFGQEALSATTRRLFDEQSEMAIKAIADYFTAMVTALAVAGNYNSFVGPVSATVPVVYPTYAKGLDDFDMGSLDALDAAFTSIKAPEENRAVLLNPQYYAKLRKDPRLSFLYAASMRDGATTDFLTEGKLPKLTGFAPFKAPYFPTSANRVGFAFQKAGVMLKSRLPQDFTQALGAMIPGSVTTITDPDTGISIMLVQYVSLQGGFAEWRPEVILGAAVGEPRGGLVLTNQ